MKEGKTWVARTLHQSARSGGKENFTISYGLWLV
jgi:hypothetical protein